MSTIINSVISLFMLMLIGAYGKVRNIITDHVNKGLIEILLNITLPLMIVSSFVLTYDDSVKDNVAKMFAYSFLAYIIMGIFSFHFLLPVKKDKKTILQFSNVFPNIGYVGFPILNTLFGAEAVLYGSIFNMFFSIYLWTYGIIIFKGDFKWKDAGSEMLKLTRNPSVLAVVFGVILMTTNISLPAFLNISIEAVGSMTGPLAMMIIGVILTNVKFGSYMKDWTLYYGILLKLIIMPLTLYLLFKIVGDDSIVAKTVILLSAMPSAIMTSIFAERFKKEEAYAAVMVFSTTLLSILTLPLIIALVIN
ncbi:AEC family transporter [Serpentinicella sp. ANB-PHB4]|uniref:AEC family transporter n=1 Tax=Serpentinicella sp. ANB-PHB4 TaxID=3074076 RepID=UPI0028577AFD|nr:AEC family transporter [Serpentinicella sp. ANB-PHB4]MDR5659640.1 AEC family transporter [Serpentinicella sp. ANB-PHB4]